MEAVTCPGSGEKGAVVGLVQRADLALRLNGGEIEQRVLVVDRLVDGLGGDIGVEANEVVHLFGAALQRVHPVVRGGGVRAGGLVIPGSPTAAGARHEALAGVQVRAIWLILEVTEHLGLLLGGISQQAQTLIGVSGEDDLVEALRAKAVRADLDVVGQSAHAADGRLQMNAICKGHDETLYILARSAIHRAPRVLRMQAEETVVVPEAEQRDGREAEHLLRWRAPHRAAHGNEIALDEVLAIAARGDVVGQCHALETWVIQCCDGFLVEAIELNEEPPVPWTEEVSALGEKLIDAAAIPLGVAGGVLHAERHDGGLRRDVQGLEEAREVRVGDLIVNHEAGVDGDLAFTFLHRDGVAVPTDMSACLEYGNFEVTMKEVGAAEAGDAAADDG